MPIDLLPAEHEAPACTAYTRQIGASPAGSGLTLDRIVVVSAAGPWPKPALGHAMLKPLVAPLTASAAMTRLFAGEPAAQSAMIEVYERSGLGATLASFDPDELSADEAVQQAWIDRTIKVVAETPIGELHNTAAQHSGTHRALRSPVMLICTQGSHDNCCGVHGERFANAVDTSRPDVAVRRVSHTGGHRFAPTAMSLPDGRMWAWLDDELLTRVVDKTLTADDLATRCRGWWGVPKGEAQVAEIAARIDHGAPFDHAPVVTAVHDAQSGRYLVNADAQSWTVQVGVARSIPTIACESPGGLPAKQSVEYNWTVVQ